MLFNFSPVQVVAVKSLFNHSFTCTEEEKAGQKADANDK